MATCSESDKGIGKDAGRLFVLKIALIAQLQGNINHYTSGKQVLLPVICLFFFNILIYIFADQ
jgi:hypothetical protein